MPSPLADPLLGMVGRGFGTQVETPAADAAAWSLVAILILCLGGLAATLRLIATRKARTKVDPTPGPEEVPHSAEPADEPAPWQKPADWWKS